MIHKTIFQYKILEKLGEGGMGVVYKAEDTKLDRFVALKFLPTHLGQSEEEKKRFIHEAKAASALDHNNICTIYDINETEDGQMFIAMAYYEGETLKARTERGPLALEQVIDMAMQVAQGLARAHEEKIVHRDIKPANIMITNRGEVKIVDFGLAKLSGRTLLTKEGTTLGTVAYMSPEQIQGSDVDRRTDIWSLGVVLYEMLTGEQPFKGDYEQAVIYSIIHENPEPPTALRSGVPMELERIILKAMTAEQSERYQHIDEMLVDLNARQKTAETLNRKKAQTAVGRGIKRSLTRSKWPITVGFVIVALLAILATFLFNSLESDSITAEKSIAVLPFTDMSPLKDQEYFGDGMAEAVINALARIPGLKVSARTSAFQFKGSGSDIKTIGKKLSVSTVLEGSVAKSGKRLRVTAQLINVADGFQLWSDTYDRELTDIFAIQDDLSSSIVAALKVKLSAEETASIPTRKPLSVEAYNLYLKGRYFWNKRTAKTMQESIDYFQQALDIDPTYALAYVGLADAYNMLGTWQNLEPNETFMKVQTATQKALEIDDTLAEAHTALAWFKFIYNWDWLDAEREFLRAIELNPNYATAHQWYAMFLGTRGRHDEARVEIRKAMELDPLSLIINGVSGWLYQWAGQYDEAIMQGQKTLEMDPHYIPTHFWLFDWYFEKGMLDEAFTHFMGHYPSHFDLTRAEAEILNAHYKDSGWSGVGRYMIDKLQVMSRERYVSPSQISLYYIMVKDYTRALDFLEKAYQIRSAEMIYLGVQGKMKFKALHSEPRFQALLKKIDLPQ